MLRKILLFLTLSALLVTSGCGLRIDTDPPAAPEPDAQEVARQAAIADVLEVKTLAKDFLGEVSAGAVSLPDGADASAVETLLGEIDSQTDLHLQLLGSQTASQAEDGAESQTAEDVDTAESQPVTLRRLHTTLGQNTLRLIEQTGETDAALGRLLGSIAVAMRSWDLDLALATEPAEPADDEGANVSAEELAFEELPGLTELEAPAKDWVPIVASWDRIGYLLEIAAARSAENRSATQEEAHEYRQRAAQWAKALGIAGGDDDPRLVSYRSPELSGTFSEDVAAIQDEVRANVAEINFMLGDLLYAVDENQREAVVVELIHIRQDNQRWGVPAANLPGLREHAVN